MIMLLPTATEADREQPNLEDIDLILGTVNNRLQNPVFRSLLRQLYANPDAPPSAQDVARAILILMATAMLREQRAAAKQAPAAPVKTPTKWERFWAQVRAWKRSRVSTSC